MEFNAWAYQLGDNYLDARRVLVGGWYEGIKICGDLALWATVLLIGFAITKPPLEKLLARKPHLT